MSNTGGGHKASAEALKQAFESEHGDDYKVCSVRTGGGACLRGLVSEALVLNL
jgi:hypothetical protein